MQQILSKRHGSVRWAIFFALCVVFVLVRLHAVFTPDVSRMLPLIDEMPTGNIAKDLAAGDGLLLSAPFYQFKPFAAGTLIEGVVAWPFFELFGPSAVSLKLAAITFGLLTMGVWFFLLWRCCGPLASILAGCLFSFGPFGYINLSATAWGNHTESALFASIGLALLMRTYFDSHPARMPSLFGLFFAGVVSGFGAYFAYTGAIWAVFGLLIVIFIGGSLPWKGPVWVYLCGAAIGFSPIIVSIRAYGLFALKRIDTYGGYAGQALVNADHFFAETSPAMAVKKFLSAFMHDLPASFCFPPLLGKQGIFWDWVLYVLFLAFMVFWVVAYRNELFGLMKKLFSGKKSREEIIGLLFASVFLFPIFYIAAYAVSGFRVSDISSPHPGNYVDYRYFAPIFPFLFAGMGIAVQALFDKVKNNSFGKIVVLLVVAGLVGWLALFPLSMSKVGKDFRATTIRGDFYSLIVQRIAMEISKHEHRLTGKLQWIEKIPPEFRPVFYEKLAYINPSTFKLSIVLASKIKSDLHFAKDAYRGFGKRIGKEATDELQGDVEKAVSRLLESGPVDSPSENQAFLEGAGEGLYFALAAYHPDKWHQVWLVKQTGIWNTVENESDRYGLLVGIGRGIGANFELNDLMGLESYEGFWVGVGKQLRQNALIQLLRNDLAIDSIESFPPEVKPWVLKGWLMQSREISTESEPSGK